jgi:tetratricopeptide (TPR) repeat protein
MKTQKLKFIILTFGTVFLTSCSELLYTSLDVLRPAKVTFAPTANNLLIVNNTTVQPSNLGHRTELLNQKTKNVSVDTDSIPLFCLGALNEDLENNGFFSSVKLVPNSLNTSPNFSIISPLDKDTVKKLCFENNADVVLSLDKIKVNDDISEYYLNETSSFLAVFEVRYESWWSIHYPNSPETTSVQFKDTIYWETESYVRKKLLDGLPKRMDGIIDGALNVGKKSTGRFLPYWEKVDRYFFNSKNKYMTQGMGFVYTKEWKKAIDSWEKILFTSKNTTIRAQAANNIAIAYEISGNIDKAINYAVLSYNSFAESYFSDYRTITRIYEYLEELNTRKKDIATLKKQLGE